MHSRYLFAYPTILSIKSKSFLSPTVTAHKLFTFLSSFAFLHPFFFYHSALVFMLSFCLFLCHCLHSFSTIFIYRYKHKNNTTAPALQIYKNKCISDLIFGLYVHTCSMSLEKNCALFWQVRKAAAGFCHSRIQLYMN